MSQKYQTTTIAVSVHGEKDNPIYAEGATTVTVTDEGGGAFVLLRQNTPHGEDNNEQRYDIEELIAVTEAATELIANYHVEVES